MNNPVILFSIEHSREPVKNLVPLLYLLKVVLRKGREDGGWLIVKRTLRPNFLIIVLWVQTVPNVSGLPENRLSTYVLVRSDPGH